MPTITTSDGVRLNSSDEGAGTPVESRELQRAAPAAATNQPASVVTLADCGHTPDLDRPEPTNAAIPEFLK